MSRFMAGWIVAMCFAAGLFFLRFWRRTHDRLFGWFALAFWIMGAHWMALAFTVSENEFRPVFYFMRLLAFLVILFAILDKNRSRRVR